MQLGTRGGLAVAGVVLLAGVVVRAMRGDRFASVAQGLGWHARAVFGPGL